MGFAQEWHGITSDSPTKMKKTLVSSSENEIVIDVNLDGFYTKSVATPNGKQFVVSVDDMAAELETGAPQLSYDVIPVMIGDLAEMKVDVVNSKYVDYEHIEVAPSKGNFSRQINPEDVPYTYGEMYSRNAFWPTTMVTLESPYIIRDFRGQNIWVRPFAYNPVTKTLRVYTSMTIVMTKVSDNGENRKEDRRSATIKTPAEFVSAYDRRFINFSEASKAYPFVEDNGEMLIICADQYMSGMQPLVDWKNKSGRPTTMVSVTTVGGNNDTQIKSYINNYYNNPNHNLAYVLLVGDYADITPHALNGERSDNWFGQLVGTDHYPEVFVGRFSVQTNTQVTTHVNKVLYYERDMQAGTTWGNKGLGIGYIGAGNGHYGEDDYQHIDFIRDTLLHYTYTTVTELHGGSGGSASTATISNAINQGVGIINYCNHGSETSWGVANYSTSNVNALTNDNKLPIVWSVACLNGNFNYGSECFAEAWMRATNNSTGAPTGAIGGMFSWMSQPWIPPMYGQDEMVDILTCWRNADQFNHTLGGASLNGNMAVIDKSGTSGYDTHDTWILFGDPSLMVRTDIPTTMNVSISPSILMLGMTELNVSADVDYAIATLSMNGEIIATGKILNGECTLTFPALSNVGTAELVILGYNKETFMSSIDIVPAEGPFVTVDSYEMDVPQANYGETVNMEISFKNVGVEAVNNVNVSLSTECQYVEILSGASSIATLAPDQTATMEGFQFRVAEYVPDATRAQFNVSMTAGDKQWESRINVELHAPIVVFESIEKTDETVSFTFKNNGSAPFYGGVLNITSCSSDLVFQPSEMEVDDVVMGGETLTLTADYSVAQSIEPGTTFEVAYQFVSGFFMIDDVFVLSYGAIMEDFESGTFGSEWSFSPQYQWTIVDGGTKGTKCAKSGNYNIANSDSYAIMTVNVMAAGDLTFMYKVSSEAGYTLWDKLSFYMDNQKKGEWGGTDMTGFEQFVQPVTPGTHTFKWSYTKDAYVNEGSDCAWIDDIKFPPTNIITFIAPATNLVATVDGHDVNLTWTASPVGVSYVVKRNGETIGTVTETSFADNVANSGLYTYSVYAVDAEGHMSAAVTETVELDFTGVDENEDIRLGIYPNPAESVLNVRTNATSFVYQMINNVGQVMIAGEANGNAVLDISGIERGVYFLKVIANGNTSIEKVVVK